MKYLKVATRFAFDMVTKVKETNIFVQWMPLLDKIYAENFAAGYNWLLGYLNKHDLCTFILTHPNGEAREQFSTLLKTALFKQQDVIREERHKQLFISTQPADSQNNVTKCVDQVLAMMSSANKISV